jgi:tRNA pseudouridine65 synthase
LYELISNKNVHSTHRGHEIKALFCYYVLILNNGIGRLLRDEYLFIISYGVKINDTLKPLNVLASEYMKQQNNLDFSTDETHDLDNFDVMLATVAEQQNIAVESMTPELDILYQDDYLVAINKPSGLLVHRSWLDTHATEFAVQKLRDQIGQHVYPVHRLDRPTSGVLLFVLDKDSARHLMQQFMDQTTEKKYVAVVRGHMEQGVLDYPLSYQYDKIADKKADMSKPAQEAITEYRCLSKTEVPIAVGPYSASRYSLMELVPKTGRKHQLRRHMKHLRHPIVGDTSHGDGKHNTMFRDNFDMHRLLLHAAYLCVTHPKTGQKIEIQAPLTDEFSRVLSAIGLNY